MAINSKSVVLTLVTLATIALYATVVKDIGVICWNFDDYSHGLLLPFISAYLIYEERAKIKALISDKVPFSAVGFLALIVGLFFYLAGSVLESLFIKWFSLFPTIFGLMSIFMGARFTNFVFPMIVLCFMAKPIPDSLVPRLFGPLQVLAAKVSAFVLELLNVPVFIMGNVIEIPGMKLLVEEACSGMRSLMALITVALILICFMNLTKLGQLGMILLSIIVAIALNVVRVAMTGVMAYFYDPDSAKGFFHTFSGMVVFVVGLVILYWLAKFLPERKDSNELPV